MKKYQKLICFLAIVVSFFSLVSCSSTSQESTISHSDGIINNSILAVKDYDIVGPIRATAERNFDGFKWSGNKITYDMLLKRAHEMDADDVINIKIDTIIKTTKTSQDNKDIVKKSYNYTANGLAIKYTGTLPVVPTINTTTPLKSYDFSGIETEIVKNNSFNWKTVGLVTIGSILLVGLTSSCIAN